MKLKAKITVSAYDDINRQILKNHNKNDIAIEIQPDAVINVLGNDGDNYKCEGDGIVFRISKDYLDKYFEKIED